MRQLAPLLGVSKSAVDRIIDHIGPMAGGSQRSVLVVVVHGTLVPTRDHTIAMRSKNYGYSTNHQVVIDADTQLVLVVGRPLARNRNNCKAWEESGAKAVGNTVPIADGGYPGTGRVISRRYSAGRLNSRTGREAQPVTQAGGPASSTSSPA